MQEKITKKELWALAGLMFLGFLVRVLFLGAEGIVSTDEAYFIQAGLNIASGKLYPAFGEANAGQPLFPFILSLGLGLGKDPVLTSRLISIFLSVLTLVPIHFCVRSFASKEEAVWSDLVFILAPFAVRYSILAMTHSLFNLMLVLTFLFILGAKNSKRLTWGVLAGLASSAVYLTRVEGLAFVLFVGLGTLFLEGLGLRFFAIWFLSLTLFSFPFWLWLRKVHGVWQLIWMEGSGALSEFSHHWSHYSKGTSAVYFYLRELSKTYYLLLPRIFPVLVWIVLGVGAAKIFSVKKSERPPAILVLLFASFPIFFYPLFGIDPRYLSPTGIFFSMFAGVGLQNFCEKGKNVKWIRGFCLLILVLNFLPGYGQVLGANRDAPLEHQQAGEWIRDHVSGPQVITASDKLSCFYAGKKCERFVWLGLQMDRLRRGERFEDILKQEGANLIVADTRYMANWTEFQFLFKGPPAWLTRLAEFGEGKEKILIYRFSPDESMRRAPA